MVDHAAGRLADFEPDRPWDIVFSRGHEGPRVLGADNVDRPALQFATKVASVAKWCDEGFGLVALANDDAPGVEENRGEEGEEDCEQEAHEIGVVEPITSPTRTTNKGAGKGKSWDARAPESLFETLQGLNCVGLGMRPLLDVRKFARRGVRMPVGGASPLSTGCAELASSGSVIKDVCTCYVSRGGEVGVRVGVRVSPPAERRRE